MDDVSEKEKIKELGLVFAFKTSNYANRHTIFYNNEIKRYRIYDEKNNFVTNYSVDLAYSCFLPIGRSSWKIVD